MKELRLRYYWVDEDGELHRVSAARYQRISDRTEFIRLFAAKTANFRAARVGVNEYSQEELVGADFSTHSFDGDGRWCKEQTTKVFRGAAGMLSCGQDENWQELFATNILSRINGNQLSWF